MNILVNASNIGQGGAAQVTHSVCETLNKFPYHNFTVVLSSSVSKVKNIVNSYKNVKVIEHSVSTSKFTKITGRENVLDNLIISENIDVVLSIFGPTWWVPKVTHLCGFALAHIVMPESPYFARMSIVERFKSYINIAIMRFFYRRCSKNYYTENPMISERLRRIFKYHNIYTVTNYYNQIYENPSKWKYVDLSGFKGKSFVTLASLYPHKNLGITLDIAKYFKKVYPDFSFRFILSIRKEDFIPLPKELEDHFLFLGPLDIETCPSVYNQSDVVFQPTLLECFTASYPEAMIMDRPLVTTDLPFARGLCGEAALYYSPLSANDAAECLYRASIDSELKNKLVYEGRKQLLKYDNYDLRSKKLVNICEQLFENLT